MINRIIKHLRTTAALCALLCGAAVSARQDNGTAAGPETADSVQAAAKLSAVRARIAELTERLGRELAQRDSLSARLRNSELEVTANRRKLEGLRGAQQAAERHRTELRAEKLQDEKALDAERAGLAAAVRSAYMMGRQEQIKLLLNQSDAMNAGRMLAYYGYFARERSARIDEISEQVRRLEAVEADIDATTQKLADIEGQAHREMANLERARGERTLSLAALTQQVANGNEELAQLKRDEQAIESLVADLTRVLQEFPVDSQQPFNQLRGRLAWPVPGKFMTRYQAPRAAAVQAGVRWNGVMIESSRGAKVRAPYFGRVVYADWLQGLGLLLIIGHSGGFMTLYGHAEALYKSVGDAVAPGDVIAVLGDAAAPQLYFEIRDGRKTVDPKEWLKAPQQ